MKHTFSDKRDITRAFPISSRHANDGDWKLFDIHDHVSETLSACSRSIFREDEYETREVPKKGKKFWESEGREQNREFGTKNEEQGNERQSEEHGESQADKILDQSGVPRREQVEEPGQKTVERESFGNLPSTALYRSPGTSRLGLLNRRWRNALEDTWNDDLIIP